MPKRNFILIAILLVAGVLLWVQRQNGNGSGTPTNEFEPVRRAYEVIHKSYFKPVDGLDLQQAAVRGMVGELDEFSTYVSPEKAEALTDRVMGQEHGLGLVLDFDGKLDFNGKTVTVVGPVYGSPAHRGGIVAGDRILAIDGKAVSGLDEQAVRKLLTGKIGEEVTLRILTAAGKPGKAGKPKNAKTVRLTHEAFAVETVVGLYRDAKDRWVHQLPDSPSLYYIRITEICPQTPQKLREVLRRCFSQRGESAVRGLVLDLRGNPGGLLVDGVAVTDLFLSKGHIVTIADRSENRRGHNAHNDTPYAKVPLVVLVDEATASAAEIVAGALAANARAVLVGQRTRGKGCVQTMIRLPDDLGQVNLTTAEFFIEQDVPIQRRAGRKSWGIEPQIPVAIPAETRKQLDRRRIAMSVMPAPSEAETDATSKVPRKGFAAAVLVADDAQLYRAAALGQKPKEMAKILKQMRTDIEARQRLREKKLQTKSRRRGEK
ncbi:MAG: PDZ domain-containing protein [Phycisphaerae bacterium]|nr:PDZ domain-containing protein [Phycisphaerae bacterium]